MIKLEVFVLLCCLFLSSFSVGQICATPGIDGPTNALPPVNTYYPPVASLTLSSGSTSLQLNSVPAMDQYNNSFGNVSIKPGDLLLFIQMQDGTINISNSNLYGGNNSTSGPDGLGGTGYTSIGNAGLYEYAVALNSVPLTGGMVNFRAAGLNGGMVNTYINFPGDGKIGKKTFQIIRVPQFSSLTLNQKIICPRFNGSVGGIIVFNVAGDFNFNGYAVDASFKGFRGGYLRNNVSGCNTSNTYVTTSEQISSGKGEGIAGTPRYMWDGYNPVDNQVNWLGFPGGFFGKGAPANAGGGGNDHNAGGGGGGNGGAGGVGGWGFQGQGNCSGDFNNPNGGRPGISVNTPDQSRLYLGGGGGGGDANDAIDGTKGGVGGGIVLINAGRIVGKGEIFSDGGNGQAGFYGGYPDGAAGGGAGGTVLINVSNNSTAASLFISANGGAGGNTANDLNNEHGPGGGGGGGVIWYNIPGATVNSEIKYGRSGLSNDGNTGAIPHGASPGQVGTAGAFNENDLPNHLRGQGTNCFPALSVTKSALHAGPGGARTAGNQATYLFTISNLSSGGGAGGVMLNDVLPDGFTFNTASVVYKGGATGPAVLVNSGTALNPVLGNFNVPAGATVEISMTADIHSSVLPGVYQNGAQVLYFDPTRTFESPVRLITAAQDAIANQNTFYQSGVVSGVKVPGTNYSNSPSGSANEDVYIVAPGSITVNNAACINHSIQLQVSPPALTPPLSFSWTGPSSFVSTLQNPAILKAQLNNAGTYTVVIKDVNGFTSTLTTAVIVHPQSFSAIDTSACKDVGYRGHFTNGKYTDTLVAANGCDSIITATLTIITKPNPDLGNDTEICDGDSLTLFPGQFDNYLWQDGSTRNKFIVKQPGQYTVTIANVCGSVKDEIQIKESVCEVRFPNAFTPEKAQNNIFRILNAHNFEAYYLAVYNRWGQKVFETKDYLKGWNGSFSGQSQAPGTYIYYCMFKRLGVIKKLKGIVMLIH